uniref:Variant surface glycoprotein 1125.1209 n=1 Tax=Trypanosoma brucei TaxID=5691 RepID=A0A1J0R6P3_9TRYP|nr:variant surface glycoprotein 1125.1209 [Trypanosoma brucei]
MCDKFVVVLLLASGSLADPTAMGNDATTWCHERAYVKVMIETIEDERTERTERIKEDTRLAAILNLPAEHEAATGPSKTRQILSIAAKQILVEKGQKLVDFLTATQRPLKYLRARLKLYDNAEAIAAHSVPTLGNGQHSSNAMNANPCSVQLTIKRTGNSICSGKTSDRATKAAVRAKISTFTKAKAVDTLTVTALLTGGKAELKGNDGSRNWNGATTVPGGCSCTTDCGTHVRITSISQTTAATKDPEAATTLPTTDTDYPQDDAAAANPTHQNKAKLLAVYKKLKEAFANKPLKLTDITLAQIKTLARKAGVDAALLDPLEKLGKAGTEASNSKLDAEMDRIYNSGADFKTNFTDNAKTIKIKITVEAGSEPMERQQIVAKGEISKALAYLKKHQLKAQLAEKSAATTAAATSASQTCQIKNKKADCKDNDGCKWNSTEKNEGDFCKPKEEEG